MSGGISASDGGMKLEFHHSYNNIFAVMTKTFAFGSRGMLNNKRLRKMNLHERTNVVITLPRVVPFFFTSHY